MNDPKLENEPREYSIGEVQEKFLKHVWCMIDYWYDQNQSTRARMTGLAFSIMVLLDGGPIGIPPFIVAPCPHEDDKQFLISEGENWYPQNRDININCDIAGGLHEIFHAFKTREED